SADCSIAPSAPTWTRSRSLPTDPDTLLQYATLIGSELGRQAEAEGLLRRFVMLAPRIQPSPRSSAPWLRPRADDPPEAFPFLDGAQGAA
ncbi:MAG: hypothetical protein HC882_02610, partial [Acidobacteria bacterium]|nr:hypothetical protein [Acidobacteriota bacterium]